MAKPKMTVEEIIKMTIEQAIFKIAELKSLKVDVIRDLIRMTDVKGAKFVSLSNYSSDKSLNTELANHVININVNYGKQLANDSLTLEQVNINKIDVNSFDYNSIDLDGVPVNVFKALVSNQLSVALAELKAPKKERANYNYKFNGALSFNFSTENFLLNGTSISKSTTQEGVYAKVKSAPLTIAKKLIKDQMELRTNDIRSFKVTNIEGGLKLNGETLEIGGAR